MPNTIRKAAFEVFSAASSKFAPYYLNRLLQQLEAGQGNEDMLLHVFEQRPDLIDAGALWRVQLAPSTQTSSELFYQAIKKGPLQEVRAYADGLMGVLENPEKTQDDFDHVYYALDDLRKFRSDVYDAHLYKRLLTQFETDADTPFLKNRTSLLVTITESIPELVTREQLDESIADYFSENRPTDIQANKLEALKGMIKTNRKALAEDAFQKQLGHVNAHHQIVMAGFRPDPAPEIIDPQRAAFAAGLLEVISYSDGAYSDLARIKQIATLPFPKDPRVELEEVFDAYWGKPVSEGDVPQSGADSFLSGDRKRITQENFQEEFAAFRKRHHAWMEAENPGSYHNPFPVPEDETSAQEAFRFMYMEVIHRAILAKLYPEDDWLFGRIPPWIILTPWEKMFLAHIRASRERESKVRKAWNDHWKERRNSREENDSGHESDRGRSREHSAESFMTLEELERKRRLEEEKKRREENERMENERRQRERAHNEFYNFLLEHERSLERAANEKIAQKEKERRAAEREALIARLMEAPREPDRGRERGRDRGGWER